MKVPKFAEYPLKRISLPDALFNELKSYASSSFFLPINEPPIYDPGYDRMVVSGISSPSPTEYAPISNALLEKLYQHLTPIMEEWAGCQVERSWGYGIRSYTRDSILHLHRDRIDTHVLSCIIHLEDKSDYPWPLDFVDHNGRHNYVLFEPGQVLFYESLCPHGRINPFQGDYYRNLYLHWRPKGWNPLPIENLQCKFKSLEQCLGSYKEPDKFKVFETPSFLDDKECSRLIEMINSSLHPSTVTQGPKDFRTSRTCHLHQFGSELVSDVDKKLADLVGVEASYSESIQGQRYDVGQYFKAHTDWFAPDTEEFKRHCSVMGQRTWTAMVYLNTVESGGETSFPILNKVVKPIQGTALIWNNLLPDGSPNYNSIHEALPVLAGSKWVITKWFRERTSTIV